MSICFCGEISKGLYIIFQVAHFKDYIPKAFPSGDDLILDAEVLLIDTNTGTPLPFGTLGKHKVIFYASNFEKKWRGHNAFALFVCSLFIPL